MNPLPLLFQSEPYTIRLGVTGHRKLHHPERVRDGVNQILARLDRQLGGICHRYIVLSPLAEGADRLVAKCVLDWKGSGASCVLSPSRLEAVLPMPRDEYLQTFDSQHRGESQAEFASLLALAGQPPSVLPRAASRQEAYERVGRYVVNNSDILLAVWDGEAARGRGGTAEIVSFAEASEHSVFRVNPKSGAIHSPPGRKGFLKQLDFLCEYNQEQPDKDPSVICQDARRRLKDLQDQWQTAGFDPTVLQPLQESVLPHLAKATRLARRYQSRYFRSVTAAYVLSACAVGWAAFLSLFFPEQTKLFCLKSP